MSLIAIMLMLYGMERPVSYQPRHDLNPSGQSSRTHKRRRVPAIALQRQGLQKRVQIADET